MITRFLFQLVFIFTTVVVQTAAGNCTTNGGIHLVRGNYTVAAMSFVAVIPGVGDAAAATYKAGKTAAKVAKAADKAGDAGKIANGADKGADIAKAGKNATNLTSQDGAAGMALQKKLSVLQDAQKNAVPKTLPDGRIRYHYPEKPARVEGNVRGAGKVVEYNPKTGNVSMWIESRDKLGNVVRVHPKMKNGIDLELPHYPPIGKELQ